MAHFSGVSGDSIASLFIFVGIGFEPCNKHYLAAFVLPGPAICFCGKMLCFLSRGYLSLDPSSSIAASLKAMQCVKLRAKGRFSYACVFVILFCFCVLIMS